MGEEDWRVHKAGSPSLDHLKRSRLHTREELEKLLGIDLVAPFALVGYHPTTIARDSTREADELFRALEAVRQNLNFCYPNADAGSRLLVDRTRAFCASHANARLFVNLDPISYWSLLQHAHVLIGNSSSGIMEASSFAIPVVNVGIRQQGREQASNVLKADANAESILEQFNVALTGSFRQSLVGMENPYGDGHAAARIVEVLASVPLGEELLIKKARPQ
jgi:UDP-N-acetylglucosamine 2-epimerase (non-hydrolysing)/GDP/UDP-N,N'-diacetylbacillosamine 2-epimerase (hydrolysing)